MRGISYENIIRNIKSDLEHKKRCRLKFRKMLFWSLRPTGLGIYRK